MYQQESIHSEFDLMDRLRHFASITPDRTVVIAPNKVLSYRGLYELTLRVRDYFTAQRFDPETLIGVHMGRRAELPAVLLGIMASGHAYVPLDPSDPPERLHGFLRASGCEQVVGDLADLASLRDRLAHDGPSSCNLIAFEDIERSSHTQRTAVPWPGSDHLAYILFTSGSTGTPKCVEITHGNLDALLRSARTILNLGTQDRYLASSTVSFDASITELFLPITAGASLVVSDRDIFADPQRFADEVCANQISIAQTTPSVWSTLLASVGALPSLRVLISHGEAISPGFARLLGTYAPEVWNLYGPTETTVWAVGQKLNGYSGTGPSASSAPIGEPLPHVSAHVLAPDGQTAEPGIEGELVLGGPSVSRGYRGDATTTAQRFCNIDGVRCYHTGDLVIRDGAGAIHYLGRMDDQMQIRGVRLEPGEIEHAIVGLNGVQSSAVTWFPTSENSRAIVAAVVPEADAQCCPAEIRDLLSEQLSRPMLPSRILVLPELPLSPSGKVDRAALRAAAIDQERQGIARPQASQTAPQLSGTRAHIATIWAELLGTSHLGDDDEFFLIGGDSLSVVEASLMAEEAFGVKLRASLIFEHPKLRDYAEQVDAVRANAAQIDEFDLVIPIKREGPGRPLFFARADQDYDWSTLRSFDNPIYALRPWRLGDGFADVRSLEELAVRSVGNIRRIQPNGPYNLAGYSLGGLLMLEIAQQLQTAGEEISFLFLLDPTEAGRIMGRDGRIRSARRREYGTLQSRFGKILEGPAAHGWRSWAGHFLRPPARLRRKMLNANSTFQQIDRRLSDPGSAPGGDLSAADHRLGFRVFAERLIDHYVAQPYSGRAILAMTGQGGQLERWCSLLDEHAWIKTIDCDHRKLFRDDNDEAWMPFLKQAMGIDPGAPGNSG